MSRKIEFRAWDKNAEYMIGAATIQYLVAQTISTLDEEYYVENYEFLQYTGVKDKNGVKIFEGDVVNVHSGQKSIRADFGYSLHRIQWREAGACFDMMHQDYLDHERQIGTTLDNGGVFSIEVVGNIYQDSHLLNENTELLECNQ